MEEGMGSGDRGSDVIKKKSSSGCLIIKKKVNGVLGFGGSSSKKGFESRNEKKRSRLVLTDSGSSEEMVEPERRRVREDIIYERRRSGIEDSRMLGFERKRGGIDVFEFDEDDGFDGKRMRMDYMDDRLKLVGRSGDYEGFEIGSSRNVVFDGRKGSVSGGRMDYDESHLPSSIFREKRREAPIESIRVQGKNGVLKVMVNKNKQQGFPVKAFEYPRADERMSSRSEAAVKKIKVTRPSFHSDLKRPEKPVPFKTEKSYVNSRKAAPILNSKAEDKDEDSDSNDSENSLQKETSEQAQRSKKAIDNEHQKTTQTEILTPPTGGKESKVKRGNGTEKQLLREKIRSMLLDRGWKIDYRPRRNRDYLDAVYINPAGTAYWSIIKAYDALQKQLEEEEDNVKPCDESTSFTPLPEEIISKLTRQTRKKIERELKKKKRDAVCSREEITRRESLRGRLHEADHVNGNDSGDNLYQVKANKDKLERQSATNSHIIQGRKSRKIGRCTLLVRSSDNGLNSEADGYVPYPGKRTILSWLVDLGIVQTGEKVQYMNGRKTRVMLEGWITKDGIHCGCCSKILTVSKFEIHAGSKQRQPFLNIYLESGISLMQCQIDAWNKQKESEREAFHSVDVDGDDPNDDTCGLCGDGGDLICCDGCPSTFHQSCLDIKMLPAGDWHCPNCTCKFCGFAGRSNAKADDRTDSSLLLCSLCEKQYHPSCSQDEVDISVNSGNTAYSFCGKNCQEIFSHLQKLLGVKHELESGFSWSLVHRMDPALERLHLGFPQRVECNSKLALALSVMDECFLPIVDRRSGINLIHNVLHNCGSNFTRLSYSAFYTAVLEKGDEIISAASIRIHGMQLAEMPFIGTRHIYRRQGMCRRLLSAIELALSTLKVEKLIIPAIAEHMNTWTEKFNFSPLEKSHKQKMRSMNMLVFPGTDMLQKLLIKQEITEGSIKKEITEGSIKREITEGSTGLQSTKANEDSPTLPVFGVSETDSSRKHDFNTSEGTDLGPSTETGPAIKLIPVNNLAESLGFKSTSPLKEHPGTFVAQKAELGQSVKDHHRTQSSVDCGITLEEKAKTSSDELIGDFFCETSDGKIEDDDATVILDSVSEHDSGSCGTSESTHVQSDTSNHTAVDSDNTCEVYMNDTSANPPKDSIEQFCAKHNVDDDTLREKSTVNIEEDATAIQNSILVHDCVSRITSESRHIDTNMSDHTAVDLIDTCEGHVNDTSASPRKDAAEHSKDVVEDGTSCETFASTIKEDTAAIQNSVFVHNSVSLGAGGSTHIDFDMTNKTAYDLDNNCEVNANETSVNSLKDSAGHLPSKDIVKDDTVCETFCGSIKEDATALQNSLSAHESISLDMTNLTKVDLDSSCEVHLNNNSINSPKDFAEQLSSKDIVEGDTLRETFSGTLKEDAAAIQNSVSVLDSVSLVACGSTHVDSDMTNLTAVDLDNSCEVNVNDSHVNFHKDSAEKLSSKDVVQNDALIEAFSGTFKEHATVIQDSVSVHDSVSLGACESTHIDSDMTNLTAVDLDSSRDVKVNDFYMNYHKDSAEQLSSKDLVQNDTLRESFSGIIKEDANAIQNSVSVHDSVSLGACEGVHNDFDMTNPSAVELDNYLKVNVSDTIVSYPKDAMEQLSAKDNVEDDRLCETSAGNIVEDEDSIQNSVSVQLCVSRDTFENTHTDFDTSKHTAVNLDNTCEVDLNDTFVNSPKNSVEQSSTENTVKEDVTAIGIITQSNGGNAVDGVREVEQKAAYVEPVMDLSNKTLPMNSTSLAVGEDPSELSSASDMVADERKGGLKNSIIGDGQEVDVKVASIELIVDSICGTSVANNTCQALDENGTGSTSDEGTKDIISDSFPSDDMKSDSHVTATEVVSNSIR